MSDSETYLLRWRGRVSGPFAIEIILQKLGDHEIGVWHEIQHQGAWSTVEEFLALREQTAREEAQPRAPIQAEEQKHEEAPVHQEFAPLPLATPTMPAGGTPVAQPLYRPKSMKLFCFLGLTLGFAGAHNFYAGYWGTAIAQVLLTVVTCWLGFGILR